MTYVLVIVLALAVLAVVLWAIPRGPRPGTARADADALPPTPQTAMGGGTPLAPGADPPHLDETK